MSERDIEQRVASLETAVAAVGTDVKSIWGAVESMRASLKTPWNNILAAVGLSVVLVGAIGVAWTRPIDAAVHGLAQTVSQYKETLEKDLDRRERYGNEKLSHLYESLEAKIASNADIRNERLAGFERWLTKTTDTANDNAKVGATNASMLRAVQRTIETQHATLRTVLALIWEKVYGAPLNWAVPEPITNGYH